MILPLHIIPPQDRLLFIQRGHRADKITQNRKRISQQAEAPLISAGETGDEFGSVPLVRNEKIFDRLSNTPRQINDTLIDFFNRAFPTYIGGRNIRSSFSLQAGGGI